MNRHYCYKDGTRAEAGDVVKLTNIPDVYYIVIAQGGEQDALANVSPIQAWLTTACDETLFRDRAVKVGSMPNIYKVLEKAFLPF